MKKKGFTLIELLAVIVILAVIAIIAIPTIASVVDKSKMSALKDSAYGLIDAGNLYYAQYSNSNVIRFDIDNKKVTSEETDVLLKYKGNIKEGTVLINQKGQVLVCINDGNYAAYKNFSETEASVAKSKKGCEVPSGTTTVYLDDERTIAEYSNEELTSIVTELQNKISVQDEEIKKLKEEKANISVTDTIVVDHNTDISTLNNSVALINTKLAGYNTKFSTINTDLQTLKNDFNKQTTQTFYFSTTSNNVHDVIKQQYASLPIGVSTIEISCNGFHYAVLIQKADANYGSALVFTYGSSSLFFYTNTNNSWAARII